MSFPGSPQLLKAGIALLDAETGAVQRIINLQYNPDTLSRTLQVQGVGAEAGDRSETLRLKGPPVETIKLEAEIDAVDELEQPDRNPAAVAFGVGPALAALETLVYPSTAQLKTNQQLSAAGTLEIVPMVVPLSVFVWSKNRVVPVRLTEFSIQEEAFDTSLNPIRAKVTLGMRVLSVDDLPSNGFAASLYLGYQQNKEGLAARAAGSLAALGLRNIG